MKFTTLVLGLLATSIQAHHEGANVPQCKEGDVGMPIPAHEPCADCVRTWHPPHKVDTDGCGDFGKGEWHWIRPAPKPSKPDAPCIASTVTVAHVKTVVDCAAASKVTQSSGMIMNPAATWHPQPTATGNSNSKDAQVTSASSPTSGHMPVHPHTPVTVTLSSARFGWKGSYDGSPTAPTLVGTPFPTHGNSSLIHRPHTPVTGIQPAPYHYNATKAAPAVPTISNTHATSGACSGKYNMQFIALVGFVAVLAL